MWRLEKKLAAGGMGEVFLARTPEDDRVAVKLTPLQQEVSLLVKLRHPSIVSILGYAALSQEIFGEERGPCYWMEYIQGRELLEAAKKAAREEILAWLTQALEALQYLHSQGILHGDLSPGNILIDSKGKLKLVDFGVAGFLGSDDVTLMSAATLPYMAPEKIDGQAVPASDLYSLGTIFYQALTGHHPRAGCRSLEELIQSKPKPLGPSLAERIIDRMIRVDLAERFSEACEVLEALRGGAIGAPRTATDYHAAKMFGADEHFEKVSKWLEHAKKQSVLLCIHGATGVGKSRFAREAAFQASLAGLKVRSFLSLERKSPAELVPLLKFRSLSGSSGELIIFEWNDDGVKPESRSFFEGLRSWPTFQEIHLQNLNPKQTLEFLKGALGPDAIEASGWLFDQTGGNPLLLRELTRCLLEKRSETGQAFSKRWIQELKKLHSLEDVLQLRLAGLDAPETEILQYVATAHEPVSVDSLKAALPETSTGFLSPGLSRLIRKELLSQEPQTGLYRLAVPSLESAILKPLAPALLQKVHRRWIESLEGIPDDNRQKLHHAIALENSALVGSGARPCLERLSSEGKKQEALEILARALPLVRDADEVSRLLRLKINLLNDLGRLEAALEVCDAWFELNARDEPQTLRAAKYWFITGLNHHNLGNREEAASRLKRCLEEADANDPAHRPFVIRSYSLLGVYEKSLGRIEEAKSMLRKGLELAGPSGRRRAEICRNLAETHSAEGDWRGAQRLLEEAIRLYQDDHYDEGEFYVRLQEGNLALTHQDLDVAARAYALAQEVADRRDDDLQRALVVSNQGSLARKRGDLAGSLKLLSDAHTIFQLLGNRRDLAQNLSQLAMTEAAVGRFAKASEAIQTLRQMAGDVSQASEFAQEAEAFLREVRDGAGREEDVAALRATYAKLPPELQMTFAERKDFKMRGASAGAGGPNTNLKEENTEVVVSLLNDLAELNRELLEETDMNRLLKRLMDRALELAKAENGFLVLKSEGETGPLPGFTVAVGRNISKKALEKEEYLPSLSAVKRAMQTGLPVVTDNAVDDPLFRNSKSIHLQKLKSLIALPIVGTEGVLGVFYLDHRFTRGLFEGETLAALKAFSGVAALALQKSRMIEDLKAVNRGLSDEVEIKTSEMGLMQRELKKSRQVLKNEYSEIVGRSPKMLEVLSLVDRITDAKISVWIFGESGTGKESIARALHFNSPRNTKPFVTENCSALPESLLESELFGHKKGAFTHAVADKKGILQYADGGTVFLDEIADMSLGMQAKLLRFLQEGEIRPVGSHQMVKVDVRVVSASNKPLAELVRQGKFREDLFFRLNGVTVKLPPLRERLEDLPILAEHFLEKIAQREKKPKHRVSQEAMRLLMGYDWPGNIRELQNTLETSSLFTEKGVIVPESFQFKPTLLEKFDAAKAEIRKSIPNRAISPELEKMLRVIRDEGYHRSNAARALGMSRRNFYTKLEKYGVPRDFKSLKEYVEKYVG